MKTKKKWLIMPAAAAMLAAGMIGGIAAYADTGTGTAAAPTVAEAPEANEATESTTPEAAEANEPALPGGGHDDGANATVDNEFEGVQ
jgi:hypothetical protein